MTDEARPLGMRYRLDQADGSWWELGWDRPLGTFYAQHYSPEPFDPFEEDLLAWYGTDFAELPTLAALAARLPVPVPEEVKGELAADAATHPNLGPPRFLAAARDLVDALQTAPDHHASATPLADLAPTGSGLAQPPELSASTSTNHGGLARRWSLPAAPSADALRVLHADPLLADDDVDTFATGLGIDPQLARGVLEGTLDELGVDQVAKVCENLRCSPDHLWGPALAGEIVHAYGPEDWPRTTEPLIDDPRAIGGRVLGRSGEPAALHASGGAGAGDGWHAAEGEDGLAVLVTGYVQTGVLAVDPAGRASPVDDDSRDADPHSEYHCRFRQITNPVALSVAVLDERFAQGPPGGFDVEPALAGAAQQLRNDAWPGAIDMVRFTVAGEGAEQWLGWDGRTASWQTWDDPRMYYGGDPQDVLDPSGLEDARTSSSSQLAFEAAMEAGQTMRPDPPAAAVEFASAQPFDL